MKLLDLLKLTSFPASVIRVTDARNLFASVIWKVISHIAAVSFFSVLPTVAIRFSVIAFSSLTVSGN